MVELDHVFVRDAPGAPLAEVLTGAGFVEGPPNTHPGQGTACRRFFFANAFLELLFEEEAAGPVAPVVSRTGLPARLREPEACPLGLCLRGTPLPFDGWDYTPPYLPPGMSIAMSTRSHLGEEPLLFALPRGQRPDAAPPARGLRFDHPNGARTITRVVVESPFPYDPLPGGPIACAPGPAWRLVVTLDGGSQGMSVAVGPALLVLR